MHFSPALILAALPFFASAKLALKQRQVPTSYSLLAVHSGDEAVHNQPVVASNESFYILRNSSAYCAGSDGQALSPCGAQTQVLLGNGSVAYLNVAVPAGQQIFLNSTGALSYTPPHSHEIPDGAKSTGFQPYTDGNSSGGAGSVVYNLGFGNTTAPDHDWYACPMELDNQVSYQIFSNVTGGQVDPASLAPCHSIALALIPANVTVGPFQFD